MCVCMTNVSQDVKTANQHKTKTQYHNTCPYTLMPNRCSPPPPPPSPPERALISRHYSQNQREGGREGGREGVIVLTVEYMCRVHFLVLTCFIHMSYRLTAQCRNLRRECAYNGLKTLYYRSIPILGSLGARLIIALSPFS